MVGVGYDLEHQRRRTDPATNEPLFTNCTRDFTGTVDYIFYTGWCMEPHSLHVACYSMFAASVSPFS
jgi:CCR4-NOT transcription complex subunit 6